MAEDVHAPGELEDIVQFFAAGDPATGEYHCAECRHGVTVHGDLPVCPTCGGEAWEQTAWSPLLHAVR
jgi:hypothetical protein